MLSSPFIGVGSWAVFTLSAKHSSKPKLVHHAWQASVYSAPESGWMAILLQVPVLQANPPGHSPDSCWGHWNGWGREGPNKLVHSEVSLTKYRVCGFYNWMTSSSVDIKHVELSIRSLLPSLHLSSLVDDLWWFAQGLKGSWSARSLM